ncbi:MAG: multidrug effflux MFS transporter [Pseudomonadota bacterium]|nr:multidrug effflux MFS transporter [Pseudomonadota bacterium]
MSSAEAAAPADTRTARMRATGLTIALLAALSALGQFATNMYLPALPAIATEFGSGGLLAQLTLTAYLAAFAVAQLVYGPISDRLGRKPVLVFGIIVFTVGSALCVAAPDMATLIAGRVVQASGAAGTLVAARAVVRDCFDGPAMQRVMALISMFFALVPGLAPLTGGLMQEVAHWRWIFGTTVLAGVVVFAWMILVLPETIRFRQPRLDLGGLLRGYAIVLGSSVFRRYALANLCVFASMFAFFGGSPALFIEVLGVSATEYGFYPPLASLGFIIGGAIVSRMAGRITAARICTVGLAIMLAGALLMLVLPAADVIHKHTYTVSIVIIVSGMGVFLPTAIASGLQSFPDCAGTASAMIGFLQMLGAAIGSVLVGALAPAAPLLVVPAVMFGAGLLARVIFAVEGRRG